MREYVCVCETHFTLILEIMAWACPVQQDNHSNYCTISTYCIRQDFHRANFTKKIVHKKLNNNYDFHLIFD